MTSLCSLSAQVPDDTTDSKPLGATKLDKEIFAQNLVKLRHGFVHRHRVSGREYKGCPFYSKPSLIHFKVGADLWCSSGGRKKILQNLL